MPKSSSHFRWPLVGNTQITDYLGKSVSQGSIEGAYIFNGPDNLGKTTIARFLANILLCDNYQGGQEPLPCRSCPACLGFGRGRQPGQGDEALPHGDFHIVKKGKEQKSLSVEDVRGLIKSLGLSSLWGRYKIGIIKHADHLSAGAANALLKTLEEPQEKTVIILITTELNNLPATILSRCQVLNFRTVEADVIYDYLINEHKARRSQAKDFSRLALGRPALAIKFFENREFHDKYMAQARAFLGFFEAGLNRRWQALESLVPARSGGQEAVREAGRILEVWQGLLRDKLLHEMGLENLVQHQALLSDISRQAGRKPVAALAALYDTLSQAGEYLRANVNPRLVLQAVALNI